MIQYLKGDATLPQGPIPWIVAHVVNDRGLWGAGFSGAVSNRWSAPEAQYRTWFKEKRNHHMEVPFELGAIQMVKVGPYQHVCNMLAQHDVGKRPNGAPLQYPALRQCLAELRAKAIILSARVHMPKIGCGLAGGKWETVVKLIEEELQGIEVSVYDL